MDILLVEDNPDHYEIITDALLGFEGGVAKISHARNLQQAENSMEQANFDIILFDLSLPDSTIEETVNFLTHLNIDVPVVVLSSLDDLAIAKELLRHQIQDYIPKDEISASFLNRVCSYAIERKLQQVKLEQRNKDMQAFCSMLSHDFKGSVRRISHMATFLQEDLTARIELTEKETKYFSSIQRNTNTIQSMVESLHEYLTVSYTSLTFDSINTSDLVNSIELELEESQDKKFKLIRNDNLIPIYGHFPLINHLLLNLFNNAIKYNEQTPEIRFSVENVSGSKIRIIFQDNGLGIDPKFHKDIFTPFKRLFSAEAYSGTGLGLSIVKRIVDLHKGSIHLESELGKGSIFTVILPCTG